MRHVQHADPRAHRGGQHRGLLLERVAGRVHLDEAPALGQLGEQVAVLAADEHDDPAGRVDAGELSQEPLQVRTDPVIRELAGVNAEPAHRLAF